MPDENNEPLPGASIVVDNTKAMTVSNNEGRFSISAAPGAKITVSYLVYEQ